MFDEQARLFQEYIKLNEGEQVKFEELDDDEKEFHVITVYIYKLISASRYDEAYYILSIPHIKDIIYRGYPDITPIRLIVHQFDNFDELLSLCFDSVLHRNMTMARTAMSIVDTRLSQLDTVKIQSVKELINKEKGLIKFAESTIYFDDNNIYPALFYEDFKESDIDKEVLSEHTQAENIIAFAMDLHDVELYDMEIYYLERLIKCRPDNKEVHICLAAAKLSEALSYNSFPDGIAFQVCDLYYKLIQLLNNDTEKSAYSLAFYEYLINISGKYLDQWRGKEPDRLISLCSFYNMLLNLYYIYPLKQFLYLIEEGIIKFEYNSKDNLVIHFQEQMHNILLHRNEILLKLEEYSDDKPPKGFNSSSLDYDLSDDISSEDDASDNEDISKSGNDVESSKENDFINKKKCEYKSFKAKESFENQAKDIKNNIADSYSAMGDVAIVKDEYYYAAYNYYNGINSGSKNSYDKLNGIIDRKDVYRGLNERIKELFSFNSGNKDIKFETNEFDFIIYLMKYYDFLEKDIMLVKDAMIDYTQIILDGRR